MKHNAFLEKLLQGAKVEWKSLGEVLIRTKGTQITASKMKEVHKDNAPIKIFAGGKTFALVNFGDIPDKDVNTNPSIIVKSRGIIEFEYYDKPFSHKNEMWSYYSENENINLKFVFYFLKLNEPHFQRIGAKMQMPQIATPDTDKFQIPIPPLSVQQEIVKILDTLTALTSELTSELTLRQKQYQYYRDMLLNFKELNGGYEIEWKTLGEVAIIGTGSHDTQDAIDDGDYIFYARGISPLRLNTYDFDETAIITAGDGVGVGKVFHWAVGRYALHQRAYRIVPTSEISARYIYHYMRANFYSYIQKASVSSSVTSLRKPMLLKFPIPIPSLGEQKRIVEILDKFDTLTNSISEGLPKEIELRNKQYEYYREMLLGFEKV